METLGTAFQNSDGHTFGNVIILNILLEVYLASRMEAS